MVGVGVLMVLSAILDWHDPATAGAAEKFNVFGAGMIAAWVLLVRPRLPETPGLLVAGGLVFVSGTWMAVHAVPLGDLMTGAGAALVIARIASNRGSMLGDLLALSPVAFLGEISYGLYLWHQVIHYLLSRLGVLSTSYPIGLVELTAVTICVATGTYYLVERPAMRSGRWLATRRIAFPTRLRFPGSAAIRSLAEGP